MAAMGLARRELPELPLTSGTLGRVPVGERVGEVTVPLVPTLVAMVPEGVEAGAETGDETGDEAGLALDFRVVEEAAGVETGAEEMGALETAAPEPPVRGN